MAAAVLHLRIQTASGRDDELVAYLKAALPYYESLPGVKVRLLQAQEDPSKFIEAIEYPDARTLEWDQQRSETDPRMCALLNTWRGLLSKPAVVETYRDISERIR